ncbi:MAG: copper chaperone PCu(A)C [Pseudomonadota bacterium]
MKHSLATICLSLGLSTGAFAGDAGMAKVGDVMIHDGWARASIGSAPNSAAYMTLMTHGDAADKLVGATTPVAETVELHNHIIEGDIAKMREVEAIEVKPGEMATLEPGGYHVMLIGLKEPLTAGEVLPLTLTFEQAGEVTLEVPIKDLKGGMKHGHDHKHGEGHKHDG